MQMSCTLFQVLQGEKLAIARSLAIIFKRSYRALDLIPPTAWLINRDYETNE